MLTVRQGQHFAVILAFVALMNGCTPLVNARGHQKIYHGAWFTIRYPEEFIPKGSLPSFSNDGFDSVFFLEPYGLVEFYVYSPQWGGIASDVKLMSAQEELISKSEEKTKSHKVLWITVAAKDGSYLRSIEEKRSIDGFKVTVFSIKYRDAKALSAFRDAYTDFKQSLIQSAD